MQATRKDGYMPKGTTIDGRVTDVFSGPQVLPADMVNGRNWDLITHGGFLTYPHRDGTGMGTYTFVRTGGKIWVYLRPDLDKFATRTEAYNASNGMFDYGKPPFADHLDEMQAILLEEGDIL